MQFVENPLRRGVKRVKVINEEDVSTKIELTQAIEAIGKILYEREHMKKEGPIYAFEVCYMVIRCIYEIIPSTRSVSFDC